MAHMDIHYGYNVNGVAAYIPGYLKESELKNFYEIYQRNSITKQTGLLSVVG